MENWVLLFNTQLKQSILYNIKYKGEYTSYYTIINHAYLIQRIIAKIILVDDNDSLHFDILTVKQLKYLYIIWRKNNAI